MSSTLRSCARASLCSLALMLPVGGCGTTFLLGEDMGAEVDQSVPLKQKGDACGASSECGNSLCVDHVCCETACTGLCEACNVAGSEGTCAPVPTHTDPASECAPVPPPMVDGGTDDGGTHLNLPDGGGVAMAAPCAGSCDGNRACAFPTATTSCGESFCNTSDEIAKAVCDGQGHCAFTPATCNGYVCAATACKTSCTGNQDCDAGYFCNTGGQCQAKKDIATSCLNPTECNSGYCSNNVCCNTDCTKLPSGNCAQSGYIGQCKCSPGGVVCNDVCKSYYPDLDGDGYGANNVAPTAGCGDTPPMAGYVSNNSDCYDAATINRPRARYAFPGSTYSDSADRGDGSYDYNCDGVQTKQSPEYPGAACGECGAPFSFHGSRFCFSPDTNYCANNPSATNATYLVCTLAYDSFNATYNCTDFQGFYQLCFNPPCYFYGQYGYNSTVACGAMGTYLECGGCNGAGGMTSATTSFSKAMACN